MSMEAYCWADHQTTGGPAAKLLLLVLADLVDPDEGSCIPSLDYLIKRCEMSAEAVNDTLGWLEDLGLVEFYGPNGALRLPGYCVLAAEEVRQRRERRAAKAAKRTHKEAIPVLAAREGV